MSDSPPSIKLPVEGNLPSLAGATGWLNSEPLTPALPSRQAGAGRVLDVHLHQLDPDASIRPLPGTRSTGATGSSCLGVHTRRSSPVEREVAHIVRAAEAMKIEYPIAIDSDYAIWRAFDNNYWPAMYFTDADGQIRHHRFGEGEYEYSEIVIQLLLAGAGAAGVNRELAAVNPRGVEVQADWEDLETPETYLGYERGAELSAPEGVSVDMPREYTVPDGLPLNHWALAGDWTVGRQAAVLNEVGGRIAYRFHARDLHLVLARGPGGEPIRFRVLLDGRPPGASHGVDTDEQGDGS